MVNSGEEKEVEGAKLEFVSFQLKYSSRPPHYLYTPIDVPQVQTPNYLVDSQRYY
jgi:hypothetical protein